MILPAKKYENRDKVKKDAIRARVTKAEKTEIQKWAKGAGEDVSAFLLNGAQSRHYALKKMPINIKDSTDFGNYSSASFGLLIDDLNDALSNIDVNTDLKLSEITGLKMYFFTGLNAVL
ncbi:hypothetical protein, partial [Limosilactobacillus reuteri]|uniref:hypothetical protein n=1 Tax=Limosilactobacillus reuteri TaxID=1598 RepID=UPI001CDBBFB7